MTEKLTHKRGDSYKIAIALTEDDGVTSYDLRGWTVRSQVRRRHQLVAELEFNEIDLSQGQFSLSVMNTDNWPIGTLESDIEYVDPLGMRHSTETYNIEVIKDITYD